MSVDASSVVVLPLSLLTGVWEALDSGALNTQRRHVCSTPPETLRKQHRSCGCAHSEPSECGRLLRFRTLYLTLVDDNNSWVVGIPVSRSHGVVLLSLLVTALQHTERLSCEEHIHPATAPPEQVLSMGM